MRGPRTILRERRAYRDDPLDLAAYEADLARIEDEQTRQEAFVAEAFGDEPEQTDPTGADLTAPDILPAGAVHSGQDVYADGNRCTVCGVVTGLDVCVGCTTADN